MWQVERVDVELPCLYCRSLLFFLGLSISMFVVYMGHLMAIFEGMGRLCF